jgi:Bacterial type II/III secretion system short domain
MKKYLFLFIVFVSLSSPATAADAVRVFPLQHRPATEVAGVLTGLLDSETRIVAQGQQLVVRGSAAEIARIETLLAALDKAPVNLTIHVRQTVRQGTADLSSAGDGVVRIEPGARRAAAPRLPEQRRIGNMEQSVSQTLRVLDGEHAYISVGRDVPLTGDLAVWAGRNQGYARTVVYRKVSTGFQVSPVMLGDEVLLDLVPQLQFQAEGQPEMIEFQNFRTRVRLPLGVWTEIGSSVSDGSELGKALLSYRSGNEEASRSLWVMVEP